MRSGRGGLGCPAGDLYRIAQRSEYGYDQGGFVEALAAAVPSFERRTAVWDPVLASIARQHLPESAAERWIELLRPGMQLRKAQPDERVVGQLGGLPALPDDLGWPHWAGHGPMSFVAAIDCASLPVPELDIPVPGTGTLLFFHRDSDQHPDGDVVGPWAPETQAAARVVYLPDQTDAKEASPPPGAQVYDRVDITAELIATGLDTNHPAFKAATEETPAEERAIMQRRNWDYPFRESLYDHTPHPTHRLGGHASPVQGAVEIEAAQIALARTGEHGSAEWRREAEHWTLLAQFDSDDDAGMVWGDCGTLYWLIRPEDLIARRFDAALLTWQSD